MSDTASRETGDEGAEDRSRAVSLRLENVTKVFDEGGAAVVAVDDVSLTIYDGEFVVLVGPSGCGKTTTLRMVAGLEQPTEGRIEINGVDVAGLDPRERDVAMVFQNYALYPHKTVRENISFPLKIRRYPGDEVESRVASVSEMLDIPELLERRPSDLSGGQQQRVALGRAVVRDPELFLFDEPLSNLDAKLRIQMRTELNKLHDRVGKTSVYVTHDQAEAMTLGDRVAVMNDGRIQQLAPPQVVYQQPANRFVAGFIGEPPMNFFDVTLVDRDDDRWVSCDAFDLALPDAASEAVASWDGDPDALEFGVRPQHFADADLQGITAEGRTFEAVTKVVEPMGPHLDLTMAPLDRQDDETAEFTARVSSDSTARAGETITLAVEMESTHLFDAKTGENLVV
ncbi:ABC transporter ATP-binding protein [Halobacteriaceae archaeon GCM10025711]